MPTPTIVTFLRATYSAPASDARVYSRISCAMVRMLICLGQTASHSPSFEQEPNPSASAWRTMFSARERRSGLPCGSSVRCETLAPTNKWAEAFLHEATHAPHAMQAAASIAASASSRGTGTELASGALPVLTET